LTFIACAWNITNHDASVNHCRVSNDYKRRRALAVAYLLRVGHGPNVGHADAKRSERTENKSDHATRTSELKRQAGNSVSSREDGAPKNDFARFITGHEDVELIRWWHPRRGVGGRRHIHDPGVLH
jgi:hypothetical protein